MCKKVSTGSVVLLSCCLFVAKLYSRDKVTLPTEYVRVRDIRCVTLSELQPNQIHSQKKSGLSMSINLYMISSARTHARPFLKRSCENVRASVSTAAYVRPSPLAVFRETHDQFCMWRAAQPAADVNFKTRRRCRSRGSSEETVRSFVRSRGSDSSAEHGHPTTRATQHASHTTRVFGSVSAIDHEDDHRSDTFQTITRITGTAIQVVGGCALQVVGRVSRP